MHNGGACFLIIILFSCSRWSYPCELRMKKELGTVTTLLVAIGLRVGIKKLQKVSHNTLFMMVGDSISKAVALKWKLHLHLIINIQGLPPSCKGWLTFITLLYIVLYFLVNHIFLCHWFSQLLLDGALLVKTFRVNSQDSWVIPCQINTKKSLPSPIWTKIGSYTVLVKTNPQWVSVFCCIASELEPAEKLIFRLPLVTKSIITLRLHITYQPCNHEYFVMGCLQRYPLPL